MTLLVDVGNSNIKWRELHQPDQVHVQPTATWESLLPVWRNLAPSAMWVSSVKSRAWQQQFARLSTATLGVVPHFAVVEDLTAGLALAYSEPTQLGVDRFLGLLAARARFPQTALTLISAGSALTVDYLSATGQHMGGLITPGLMMSLHALDRGTGRIGAHQPTWRAHWVPGRSTQACVSAGLAALYSGLLDQVVEATHCAGDGMGGEKPPRLLVTGGDARIITELLAGLSPSPSWSVQPYLVLDGLAWLQRFKNG